MLAAMISSRREAVVQENLTMKERGVR